MMKMKFFTKKAAAFLLMFAMIFSSLPLSAFAADEPAVTTINVDFTAQAANAFLCAPQFDVEVSSNLAESYGYKDNVTNGVSALDVLVKAHQIMFDTDFTADTKDTYLAVSDSNFVTTIFGENTSASSFAVNGACPNDGVWNDAYGSYTGYAVNQAVVNSGDFVEFFLYQDTSYLDNYTWFTQNNAKIAELTAGAGSNIALGLEGYCYAYYNCNKPEFIAEKTQPIEDAQLAWVDAATGNIEAITGAVTDEEGAVSITAPSEAGVHYLTAYMPEEDITEYFATPIFMPLLKVNVVDTAITVPADAELFVGSKTKHFVPFTEIEPVKAEENADNTKTYYFNLKNGDYNYRVSGEEYLTTAGIFKKTADAYQLSITEADLKPADKTKNTVDRDVTANDGYNVADIYLNINPQGYLKLEQVGDTYQIVNLRNWEAVNSTTGNYFIEPDYHYAVIDERGAASDVVEVDANGLLTAKKAGTAIVLVTYDAINIDGAIGGPFFGAVWPENTGVFVVSVGSGDSGINTGMTIHEGKNSSDSKLAGDALDAEHDVIYFTGDRGEYTFTPATRDCKVSVANPTVNDAMTFNGFAAVNKNSDGSYAVPLTQGRNIVKLEKDGKAEYQVITAKKVSVQVNGTDIDSLQPLTPGAEVSITFDTLYHPANKLAGVYNMSACALYADVDGYDGKLVGSASNQYKFASTATAQTVASTLKRNATPYMVNYKADGKLTIPADYAGDTFTLADGSFVALGFGDPYGNHRGITLEEGKAPNFNANVKEAYLGILPDIEIPVQPLQVESIEITAQPTKLDYYEGDAFDKTGMVVKATYTDGTSNDAVASYTVSPEVITADTTEVTVSYGGKSATVKVNVTPLVVEGITVSTPPTKTEYEAGEIFNPTGMVVTATYNNGETGEIKDYKYEPARELQASDTAMTITYTGDKAAGDAAITATTPITVAAASSGGGSDKIKVKLTLLGDSKHDSSTDGKVHTLKANNLTTWIEETEISVPAGSKVLDALSKALGLAGIPYENPTGNYITEIRGLGEFTNGASSGWMYTLNGKHPDLGVDEQALKDGDKIVFHYTDDYSQEEGSDKWSGGSGGSGTVNKTDENQTDPVVDENGFSDVKNHWAADAIDFVVKQNLFNGTTATTFEPETAMNRAMLVTVLWRLDGKPAAEAASGFADLASGAYYTDAVAWANENGIVKGYTDTQFAPNDEVTREQMAAILCRYAEFKGYDVSGTADLSSFADNGNISPYAVDNMKWAKAVGLINGRTATTLAPQGDSTRAEVATMLQRFVQNVK